MNNIRYIYHFIGVFVNKMNSIVLSIDGRNELISKE